MTVKLTQLLCAALLIISSSWAAAQDTGVSITRIVANNSISGVVKGPIDFAQHKVVVFVKTDRWYVHPFAAGGAGRSWARIGPDGTWTLPTVRREFRAVAVAALVTHIDYQEPSITENVASIPHRAMVIKNLEDSPDYGKL